MESNSDAAKSGTIVKRNIFNQFPHEILVLLFEKLEPIDQLSLMMSNKYLYNILQATYYKRIKLSKYCNINDFDFNKYAKYINVIDFSNDPIGLDKIQLLYTLKRMYPNKKYKLICSCEIISESDELIDHTKNYKGQCSCLNIGCRLNNVSQSQLNSKLNYLYELNNFEVIEYTYKYKQLSYTGEAYNIFSKLENSRLLDKVKKLNIMVDGFKVHENDIYSFERLDITHLTLNFYNTIIEDDFINMIDYFINLTYLKIKVEISIFNLNVIFKYKYNNLKQLDIEFINYYSNEIEEDDSITLDGNLFPKLEYLNIYLDDYKVEFINKFDNLLCLNIKFTLHIEQFDFQSNLFSKLSKLNVSKYHHSTQVDSLLNTNQQKQVQFNFIAQGIPTKCNLTHLNLTNFSLDIAFLKYVYTVGNNLKYLNLNSCSFNSNQHNYLNYHDLHPKLLLFPQILDYKVDTSDWEYLLLNR